MKFSGKSDYSLLGEAKSFCKKQTFNDFHLHFNLYGICAYLCLLTSLRFV